MVKKCGLLKISHEPYRSCKKNSEVVLDKLVEYDKLVEKNKEVEALLGNALLPPPCAQPYGGAHTVLEDH